MLDLDGARPSLGLRLLGFVNLLRFTQRGVGSLVSGLTALRGVPLGEFEVAEVEVVRTDKILSAVGTELLRRTTLIPR